MSKFIKLVNAQIETKQIEVCTLEQVMRLVRDNQTDIAKVLKINRGTLRKYLVKQGGKKLIMVNRDERGVIVGVELINNMHGGK